MSLIVIFTFQNTNHCVLSCRAGSDTLLDTENSNGTAIDTTNRNCKSIYLNLTIQKRCNHICFRFIEQHEPLDGKWPVVESNQGSVLEEDAIFASLVGYTDYPECDSHFLRYYVFCDCTKYFQRPRSTAVEDNHGFVQRHCDCIGRWFGSGYQSTGLSEHI